MPTWKVARPTKVCALSGRPLPPDAAVVAALFGVPEEVSEDKVLGAGLVRKDFLVEGNDQVKAAALYNLGLANQWLKNLADAIKFYEQCTAIDSPFRPLAAGNLKGLKSGYRVIK